MEREAGDDYIRKTSAFIRTNEQRLAQSGLARRRKAASVPAHSAFNPLGWVGLADNSPRAPMILSLDTYHLFYLLLRMDALGIDVGSLDVQVENPSRPMNYISLLDKDDKSDTLSIASFRSSFSVVSKLSIGSAWWGRPEPPGVDAELKYIYSSFTKLPALSIHAPGPRGIAELAEDPPDNNAVSMYPFKYLHILECLDIDPRALLGWDRLAESLKSLTIKRSGIEDPSTIFIDAVLEDQSRREGVMAKSRTRRLGHTRSFRESLLPETVREESEDRTPVSEELQSPSPPPALLSSSKWAILKHLSLSDNALTSIPSTFLTYLTSLTHLDLSSNLLVSIPSGLSALHNLVSLNLSDNMIDSVLGVYTKLGQVLTLNLSHNRLESLCGLERLVALERVDLRHNMIDESAEVGRLAVLPNVAELLVEDNPFVKLEENHRMKCFDYFWREGKTIMLDGSLPGFYERRFLTSHPSQQMTSSRPPSAVFSPPVTASGVPQQAPPSNMAPAKASPLLPPSPSSYGTNLPSPGLSAVNGRPKRRKVKRIVELDGANYDYRGSEDSMHSVVHSRTASDGAVLPTKPSFSDPAQSQGVPPTVLSVPPPVEAASLAPMRTPIKSRHSRYLTEITPPSPSLESPPPSPPGRAIYTRRSSTISSSSARRARVSASVYEPLLPAEDANSAANQMKDADAFRARIEALRAEVGDSWLHVLSQSQFAPEQVAKG